jgi:uncharacterized protein
MFNRLQYSTLCQRLTEQRRFIQILSGPRQVGKTTLARQAMASFQGVSHYASADLPSKPDAAWLEQQWAVARRTAQGQPCVLVLDEVHKVERWSEVIKMLWDEDSFNSEAANPLRVVLLGSSQFLMQQGVSESLAGRFELIRVPHWSFAEMREAFDWNLEQYIYFGGYPGAASLISDENRWRDYVLDSIIEPTLAKDVLQLTRIDKPALLRSLFVLGCHYSGQILSYQKMIGQLQDAGNTTTLSSYLTLLSGAWLLTGLEKFAGDQARSRASSPKLQALNLALVSAQLGTSFEAALKDRELWGRLVESAVGAHLHNYKPSGVALQYWRERADEVDFVLSQGERLTAIEVKSGRDKGQYPGLKHFTSNYKLSKPLVVGTGGIPLTEFLLSKPEQWL